MREPALSQALLQTTEEYALAKEMLSARARVGLSQEAVAEIMGITKSDCHRNLSEEALGSENYAILFFD